MSSSQHEPGSPSLKIVLLEVVKRRRSAIIRSVSRFFVSENCVAITTKHRFNRKYEPI
jgi:hypothetical protein